MSHVSKINLFVSDLDAFGAECSERGCVLERGPDRFRYYRNKTKPCGAKVRVPGADYEIGLVRARVGPEGVIEDPDGDGWMPLLDHYDDGGGMFAVLGEGCRDLFRGYTDRVTRAWAESEGYDVEREELGGGEYRLVLEERQICQQF